MSDAQLRAVLKAIAALAGLVSRDAEHDERIVAALDEIGARADRALDETRPVEARH